MSERTIRPVPKPVMVARALLLVVAIAHVAAIIVLLAFQDDIANALRVSNPRLGAADIGKLVVVELVRTGPFHAVLAVVCGIYAAKIPSGSRRVYRIVVASQVLSMIAGIFTLCTASGVTWWLALPFVAAAIQVLALLVAVTDARKFFVPGKGHSLKG